MTEADRFPGAVGAVPSTMIVADAVALLCATPDAVTDFVYVPSTDGTVKDQLADTIPAGLTEYDPSVAPSLLVRVKVVMPQADVS